MEGPVPAIGISHAWGHDDGPMGEMTGRRVLDCWFFPQHLVIHQILPRKIQRSLLGGTWCLLPLLEASINSICWITWSLFLLLGLFGLSGSGDPVQVSERATTWACKGCLKQQLHLFRLATSLAHVGHLLRQGWMQPPACRSSGVANFLLKPKSSRNVYALLGRKSHRILPILLPRNFRNFLQSWGGEGSPHDITKKSCRQREPHWRHSKHPVETAPWTYRILSLVVVELVTNTVWPETFGLSIWRLVSGA